jgi:peptidyl-prolyl cis-trans isomerase D
MMKAMRENTKIILWVVVVAFVITIFAVWGLDLQSGSGSKQKNVVGRVNGTPITPQAYQAVYTQLAQQYRTNAKNQELTATQQEMLRDEAWENIVSNILTGEQIKKLGIGVTDEEVLNTIRTSPPPEVQQYFHDDKGNFDYAAYQAALNNPDADWSAVEDMVRQRIPMLKLNQFLMAQVHVSNTDIRNAFDEQTVKMVAHYVEFPVDTEDLGDWKPSDDDVSAYYNAHKDEFKQPEKAVLQLVRIPRKPSDSDRSDLLYTAAHIRDQAAGGEDFASLAKTYSEAHTGSVGGETGFLGATQRDPAVMAAVAGLKPGEISKPVETNDGVYVVQLIGSRTEKGEKQYNMREIFLKLTPGAATTDSLSAVAQDIKDRATEKGDLATAATAHGLEVTKTDSFAEGMPIPGIGFSPALSRFAFAVDPGTISGVIIDDVNFYVARLDSRTPASTKPFDDVSDAIRKTLVHERKVDMATRKADAFRRTAAAPNTAFDKAAAQYSLKVAKTDSFTVSSPVAGQQPNSNFARAAITTPPGEVTRPIESGNSVFVIRVDGRVDPKPEEFQKRAQQIRDQIYRQRVQEYVLYWYDDIRKKSAIEDFRERS